LPKWLNTFSAGLLVGAIAFATVVDAQRKGFSRDDAALRTKPPGTPSGLGRPIEKGELDEWDISIAPDGGGLPPGSGSAAQGAVLFTPRGCTDCHGPNGYEGPAPILVEDSPAHPARIKQMPFPSLIWDFIRRAMPYDRPGRLSNDEVYALTAFLLFRNGIIQETDVMDAKSLARVQMPHRAEYMPPPPWKPRSSPRAFTITPP
jgi:cytochrome c